MTSPCISVCTTDPETGYCLGCFRTRKEIATWRHMTETEQKAVLTLLRERKGLPKRK